VRKPLGTARQARNRTRATDHTDLRESRPLHSHSIVPGGFEVTS